MKIGMIEYQGRCDEKGVAVGHSPKVLGEYYKIANESASVQVLAPRTILRSVDSSISRQAKVLPYSIGMTGHKSLFTRIGNKLRMFDNIKLAIKSCDADILWFYNVEFYFWLYIYLHKRAKQKIVCTLFISGYQGGIVAKLKQAIFEKAQKKVDYIIGTGASFSYKNVRFSFIPDYIYESEKMEKYHGVKKQDYAVCIGTMDRGKQLEPLIDAFNHNGYKLIIAGRFYDKEWYQELSNMAKDNVEIIDNYLDSDSYMKLLSEARFCVLPYSPNKYGIQTSGVLQEAMFVDTIPVSFDKVLEGSGLPGVGIDAWEDLYDVKRLAENPDIKEKMAKLRKEVYDQKVVLDNYKKIFAECSMSACSK